jgi:hypothetical protein
MNMKEDLGRILGSGEILEPSPDFVDSVMLEIRLGYSTAAPLRFPWMRFAIYFIGGLLCALLSAVMLLAEKLAGNHFLESIARIFAESAWSGDIYGIAIALLGSLLIVRISVEFSS